MMMMTHFWSGSSFPRLSFIWFLRFVLRYSEHLTPQRARYVMAEYVLSLLRKNVSENSWKASRMIITESVLMSRWFGFVVVIEGLAPGPLCRYHAIYFATRDTVWMFEGFP
jgi:hypothetical protein